MINSTDIRRRLLNGDWYSFSADHSIRWKVLRVFGDGSIQKRFHDSRTGEEGLTRRKDMDVSFTKLTEMFEAGRMVFVDSIQK